MKLLLRNLMQFIFLRVFYRFAPTLTNFFLYRYFISGITLFNSNLAKNQNNTLNILLLNPMRFMQDIESISLVKDVNLLFLDSTVQYRLNSFFLPHHTSFTVSRYITPDIYTEKLVACLSGFLKRAKEDLGVQCILSPSFQYRQDFPYQSASKISGINYFVIFKEYLKDPAVKDQFTKEYKNKQYKFLGSKMFLANEILEEIVVDSGVSKRDNLSVVGSPRIDNIHRMLMKEKVTNKIPAVTFFSFMHCSGGVRLKDPLEHFSYDSNDGFYNLFYDTHKSVINLALLNPEINFNIKLKYEGEWLENIEHIALQEFRRDIASIANLEVSSKGNVHDLILASDLIIAFNSTTVIETLLLQQPLLIPIFAEAAGKYKDRVYFSKYMHYFDYANSNSEFESKIQSSIDTKFTHLQSVECPADLVKEYIDSFDGHSADKMINEIKEILL
jgi:hypothetical protein